MSCRLQDRDGWVSLDELMTALSTWFDESAREHEYVIIGALLTNYFRKLAKEQVCCCCISLSFVPAVYLCNLNVLRICCVSCDGQAASIADAKKNVAQLQQKASQTEAKHIRSASIVAEVQCSTLIFAHSLRDRPNRFLNACVYCA